MWAWEFPRPDRNALGTYIHTQWKINHQFVKQILIIGLRQRVAVVVYFQYDLPEAIGLPDVICNLDNLLIPNSWKTIAAYKYKHDVKRMATSPTRGAVDNDKIIILTETYNAQTLRDDSLSNLNTAYGIGFTMTYE